MTDKPRIRVPVGSTPALPVGDGLALLLADPPYVHEFRAADDISPAEMAQLLPLFLVAQGQRVVGIRDWLDSTGLHRHFVSREVG